MLIPTYSLPTFTLVHVAISLAAIASGCVVLFGMIADKRLARWTAFFLTTTVLTSATGFGFPIEGMTPGIAFGIISLAVLLPVVYARYSRHLAGVWRLVYIFGALLALYLNYVVMVIQSFRKVPVLHALSPDQNETASLAVHVVSLAMIITLGSLAVKKFRPASSGST